MASLTERYLEAALSGIPQPKRADVESELRSSIADAIDDRVKGGEDVKDAERSVLENLGDPARLSAGITGRPTYLIGPELFFSWRRMLSVLLVIVVPIAGVSVGVVELVRGGTIGSAIVAGGGVAITTAVHLGFWITLAFALIERADAARNKSDRSDPFFGRWTVDHLPPARSLRISVGETIGDILSNLLLIGFLLVVSGFTWTDPATNQQMPIVEPSIFSFWLPFIIVVLFALVGFRIVLHLVGRWTMTLAVVHLIIELLFVLPVVYLALNGILINPAFAAAIGYPPLAEGEGPVMIIVAITVVLVTGYEIIDGFRKALKAERQQGSAISEGGDAPS